MAEIAANSSTFAHPSAVSSAEQPFQSLVNTVGELGKSLEGISAWQAIVTILLLSVTYDQGLWLLLPLSNNCDKFLEIGGDCKKFGLTIHFALFSSVPLAKGQHCWTLI
jgi:hypothetical protein